LIPHNDRPKQTLTACTPSHASADVCLLILQTHLFDIKDPYAAKMMSVLRASTADFSADSHLPPALKRLLTIEYP
jgi:hypothetical protein